jgi:catechol-2,3-dioxygenase
VTSQEPTSRSPIISLMHVIYFVQDLERSLSFYRDLLGFQVVDSLGAGTVFLRYRESSEYFDVGLIATDEAPEESSRRAGVYHVGWEVASLEEFLKLYEMLDQADAIIGTSDHGTHASIYACDADNNEVELCWRRPRQEWPLHGFVVKPLEIELLRERPKT